jgi:hypothetical protein
VFVSVSKGVLARKSAVPFRGDDRRESRRIGGQIRDPAARGVTRAGLNPPRMQCGGTTVTRAVWLTRVTARSSRRGSR